MHEVSTTTSTAIATMTVVRRVRRSLRHKAAIQERRGEPMVERLKGVVTATLGTICILIPTLAEAQIDGMNADEAALLYAKQVPGYGGTYYDSDGVAHVYVTDMSQSGPAALMLNTAEEIKFELGKFSFVELHAYRGRMADVMSDPNTVYLDIDERSNRVTVGVSKESAPKSEERRSGAALQRPS